MRSLGLEKGGFLEAAREEGIYLHEGVLFNPPLNGRERTGGGRAGGDPFMNGKGEEGIRCSPRKGCQIAKEHLNSQKKKNLLLKAGGSTNPDVKRKEVSL